MILQKTLEDFVNQHLVDKNAFLVAVNLRPGNRIQVLIDGQNGVQISDCMELSRAIEAAFDRDQEDYDLEVSSVGIGAPLRMPKQYQINVGRLIMVMGQDLKKNRGKLIRVTDEGIEIELESKKAKKKSNEAYEATTLYFSFADIKEARIQVSFD